MAESALSRIAIPPRLLLPLIPSLAFFIIFLIIPIGVVIGYSLEPNQLVTSSDSTSLDNYAYFLERPHYTGVIVRTLRFAFITTFISVTVGYITSLILRGVSQKFGSTAVLILAFPILSGPIVTVMGWMTMLTSDGVVGRSIATTRSILGMSETSTRLLGTDTAVIIGMVHFNLAFVILNLVNVMLKLDPVLEEAAMNLGANRWRVFRHIIWPLSLPGVFSATLISFSLAMNAFVTPSFLGNASRLVLTTQVSQFMLTSYNWQMASVAGVILLWVSLFFIALHSVIFSRYIKS